MIWYFTRNKMEPIKYTEADRKFYYQPRDYFIEFFKLYTLGGGGGRER